jgi:hypothetical protein
MSHGLITRKGKENEWKEQRKNNTITKRICLCEGASSISLAPNPDKVREQFGKEDAVEAFLEI